MPQHAYDDPTIDDIEFMLAVRKDPTMALAVRMDAAVWLIKMGYGDIAYIRPPTIIYRFADYVDPVNNKEPADDVAA